ncbi:hypothetical protein [Desulfosporosinus sp. OT]|uniref:hypothetical protein n=1 Tax=Desulfosporosinus sp. OT TaxID=913865 RepID=UPI000223A2ED|nr:hypothetical protein [Desulfosporosinus sp. OT]EGW38530.1 hypothetical protein DOT_3593 [Desulfosporosinus sp. OT]
MPVLVLFVAPRAVKGIKSKNRAKNTGKSLFMDNSSLKMLSLLRQRKTSKGYKKAV